MIDRRRWLRSTGCGVGSLALSALLHWDAVGAEESTGNPLAPKRPHFPARARNVIFLYMHGGASHIDSFDYRPELERRHGDPLPESVNTARNQFNANLGTILKSPWKFRQYGQSGAWVSDLFPHVGGVVDDLCFIKSMHSNNNAHTPATLELHTGTQTLMRPSVGAWVTYGLGSENENLPGFVTICPPLTYSGQRNFGAAFLPAAYQGTMIGTNRISAKQARFRNIENRSVTTVEQRRMLDLLRAGNREQLQRSGSDAEWEARIASFELAFRMQSHAPEVLDISGESQQTLSLYGIDDTVTENYGRELLLARRCVERGVRFVHVAHTGGRGGRWDQHSGLVKGHGDNARSCDKPIAGLIRDLKQRGLLDETLVIWSTEFGRTPEVQNKTGRGHHAQGFTFWLAGGGVQAGSTYGSTDAFGYHAVEHPVDLHDLHATVLYLLGLDHTRLTYRYSGRDFRLTDVAGHVLREIIA
ncbi:MAG: sulfatase [Planctomycetaceae bacterium]|nr:sulfatase [Planctomycetaceae bacterium]